MCGLFCLNISQIGWKLWIYFNDEVLSLCPFLCTTLYFVSQGYGALIWLSLACFSQCFLLKLCISCFLGWKFTLDCYSNEPCYLCLLWCSNAQSYCYWEQYTAVLRFLDSVKVLSFKFVSKDKFKRHRI